MKKITTLSIVMCALLSNNNSLCMLKRVAQIRPMARMFRTQARFNSLPQKNIFTVPHANISLELLEDYYDRNKTLKYRVAEQIQHLQKIYKQLDLLNDSTFNSAFHGHSINIQEMQRKETKLEQDFNKNFSLSAAIITKAKIDSKTRGADE